MPDVTAAEVMIGPARSGEFERVGEVTAMAYLNDGFTRAESSYLAVLRNAADRAAEAVLLVARLDGAVVGTVTYCPVESPYAELAAADEAELRMLAVSAEARGRGIGAALVRACVDRAAAAGLRTLRLSTQADMRAAHRVYEKLGFGRTPERDWSPVPGVDLITYALPIALARPVQQVPLADPAVPVRETGPEA